MPRSPGRCMAPTATKAAPSSSRAVMRRLRKSDQPFHHRFNDSALDIPRRRHHEVVDRSDVARQIEARHSLEHRFDLGAVVDRRGEQGDVLLLGEAGHRIELFVDRFEAIDRLAAAHRIGLQRLVERHPRRRLHLFGRQAEQQPHCPGLHMPDHVALQAIGRGGVDHAGEQRVAEDLVELRPPR